MEPACEISDCGVETADASATRVRLVEAVHTQKSRGGADARAEGEDESENKRGLCHPGGKY